MPALLAGVMISACGGSSHPADAAAIIKPEQTYLHAAADGDGRLACQQMTAAARQRYVRNGSATGRHSCPAVIAEASRQLTPSQRASLDSGKLGRVRIHGATASIAIKGEPPAQLIKTDGHWLLK